MKSNFEWVKSLGDKRSGWYDLIIQTEAIVSQGFPVGITNLTPISDQIAKGLALSCRIDKNLSTAKIINRLRNSNRFLNQGKILDTWKEFTEFRAFQQHEGVVKGDILEVLESMHNVFHHLCRTQGWLTGVKPKFDSAIYSTPFTVNSEGILPFNKEVLPDSVQDEINQSSNMSDEEHKEYLKSLAKEGEKLYIQNYLKLDNEQEQLINQVLQNKSRRLWGFTGGPGTGKTTISIFFIKKLFEQFENDMFEEKPKILYVTFTNSLVNTTKLLAERLEINDEFLDIQTFDSLLWKLKKSDLKVFDRPDGVFHNFFESNIDKGDLPKKLQNYHDVWEELEWVIWGRNLKSFDEYNEFKREGRKWPLLRGNPRQRIWDVKEKWEAYCQSQEKYGYKQLAQIVLNTDEVKPIYDYIIIDEAQDLSEVASQVLFKLLKRSGVVLIGADKRQEIYSVGWGWHFFKESTGESRQLRRLKTNYRMSNSIFLAVNDFSKKLLPDDGELTQKSFNTDDKIKPRLIFVDQSRVVELVHSHVNQWKVNQQSQSCILVRDYSTGKSIENDEIKYYKSASFDPNNSKTSCLTLHASKGLQFSKCLVVDNFDSNGNEDEVEKTLKLVMVGCSRAINELILIVSSEHKELYRDKLDLSLWDVLNE